MKILYISAYFAMPLTTEKMLHVKIANLTTRPKLISKYDIKIAQISSKHLIYEDAEFKDIRQRLEAKEKHTPPSPTQNIREKVGHDEQKQEKQAIHLPLCPSVDICHQSLDL